MLARRLACVCMRNANVLQATQRSIRASTADALTSTKHTSCTQQRLFTRSHRFLASQTTADQKIEEITELYATAQDEFEIASEETEKMTVYAEDDRSAAREALSELQTAYKQVVDGQDKHLGEEVRRRIGQRIRELEKAVEAMEEQAKNQD